MLISASILWKRKEFKIFQASKFSKLGMKARNLALFLTAFKVEKMSRN